MVHSCSEYAQDGSPCLEQNSVSGLFSVSEGSKCESKVSRPFQPCAKTVSAMKAECLPARLWQQDLQSSQRLDGGQEMV